MLWTNRAFRMVWLSIWIVLCALDMTNFGRLHPLQFMRSSLLQRPPDYVIWTFTLSINTDFQNEIVTPVREYLRSWACSKPGQGQVCPPSGDEGPILDVGMGWISKTVKAVASHGPESLWLDLTLLCSEVNENIPKLKGLGSAHLGTCELFAYISGYT